MRSALFFGGVAAIAIGLLLPALGFQNEKDDCDGSVEFENHHNYKKTQQMYSDIYAMLISNSEARRDAMRFSEILEFNVFHIAAIFGNLDLIEALYTDDPESIFRTDPSGFTCAHSAAQNGHLHVLKWLWQNKRKLLYKKTPADITVMHSAAIVGRLEVVKGLWALDNSFLYQSAVDGWIPAHAAVAYCRLDVIKWMWSIDQDAFARRNKEGKAPPQMINRPECTNTTRQREVQEWFHEVQQTRLAEPSGRAG